MTRRHRGRLEHSSIKGEFSILDFKVRALAGFPPGCVALVCSCVW